MFLSGTPAGNRARSTLLSLAIHVTVAMLLFTVASSREVRRALRKPVEAVTKLVEPYLAQPNHGGGGGGERSTFRASPGNLPRRAPRQFVPPAVAPPNPSPKLIMEPAVVAPDAPLPVIQMAQLGDPLAPPGPPSSGRGSGGGIGDGAGGGVGPGRGPGYGPGEGGNTGGGPNGGSSVIGHRGGISAPVLIWKVEPEYSDAARRAKVQGTVVLAIEVDRNGQPGNVRVQQSLGLGLDEKAIDSVLRWKFRPGYQNGKPVATNALIFVQFHLL